MITRLLVVVVLIVFGAGCKMKYNPEITSNDIFNTINYLASDSLKGRKPGTNGDSLTCEYVRAKFANAGLELMCEEGFQPFNVITEVELGEGNQLQVNDNTFQIEQDFLPYSFSANTEFSSNVVFAGYGFDIGKDSIVHSDYENIDVTGKWVLVLKGDPELDNSDSKYVPYSDERTKVLTALDHGAKGVLFVSGIEYSAKDELSSLFYDKNSSAYPIPVLQLTRKVADLILEVSGKTIESLETNLKNDVSSSFQLNQIVSAKVNLHQKVVEAKNVVGMLAGNDPELKDEIVIIGAHHDHLGFGGPGSGSRMIDTIAVHNGADDNASGVAAVIELAEKIASEKLNKRSMIFTTFGAEEMGLVGSKAFTNNPPIDLDKVVAMFNFDMVGRLDTLENSLSIGGVKTSLETTDILEKHNPGFNLALTDDGFGPSDHSSFYVQQIPVFFISTGAHSDYHTPNDDVEFLNIDGEKKIIDYFHDVIMDVANRQDALTYNESGTMQRSGRGGRFKVTLGIMPDFAGMEKRGLRIDAVSKGKPADNAGMLKGDIITAIDGLKVGNVYDYMSRLKTLESGQLITVDVLRNNKVEVLLVQL